MIYILHLDIGTVYGPQSRKSQKQSKSTCQQKITYTKLSQLSPARPRLFLRHHHTQREGNFFIWTHKADIPLSITIIQSRKNLCGKWRFTFACGLLRLLISTSPLQFFLGNLLELEGYLYVIAALFQLMPTRYLNYCCKDPNIVTFLGYFVIPLFYNVLILPLVLVSCSFALQLQQD